MICTDYRKYKKYGGNFFSIVFLTQGFWAILQYRAASAVYRKLRVPVLRQLLLGACLLWQKVVEICTGISIPASAVIGHSFYIGHFGNIILNAKTIMGNNCNISQGVTIGVSGRGEDRGVPVLGNNVYVGANAVLAGSISIGDNVVVGANSLVVTTIDANCSVVGVPAQKISDHGSKDYI